MVNEDEVRWIEEEELRKRQLYLEYQRHQDTNIRITKIKIEGNGATRDDFIEHYMSSVREDSLPLNEVMGELSQAVFRLRRTGIFKSVEIGLAVDETVAKRRNKRGEQLCVINVKVEENKRLNLSTTTNVGVNAVGSWVSL